ncbi:hypothetical protein DB30_07985 [Enhygromyxa salina]|uniref:Uncharacterized protein n=2 Tax=Enhygromyxa salina TaxID=215803 RepID=A0A0C2D055_9BACT|nr:hypothetical protein DB30_07985 [Enhygromyxa salina]
MFVAEELPEQLQPAARLPKELAEAVFYVYAPGSEQQLRLPGRRPGDDAAPWMNKRGAAWKAIQWLKAVTQKLPLPVLERLIPGSWLSPSLLAGDFDRRRPAHVKKKLEALGLEVLDLSALLAVEQAPGRDGLVLECFADGTEAGSYTRRWLASDRASLREMAPWLEDPATYNATTGAAQYEFWQLHVVAGGRITRSIELLEQIALDGEPASAWQAGTPKRVKVDWSAMKLPRPSPRSVEPGHEIWVAGWQELDPEDAVLLRFGENGDD